MKFSIRQILASTAGAVCAAVIASVFGVKGTIVGVAIGSAAATMATAFVAQSIERGHEAVKQVAVRAPESSSLLRRLGGTRASGQSASSVDESSAPTEVVGRSGGNAPETVEMASSLAPAAETERLEISATADSPATQRLRATTTPPPPSVGRRTTRARVLLACHCRDGGGRVRAGAAAHHGGRADLGQTPVGDLRRSGHRDHAEEHRQPVTGTDDHADVDVDHFHDLDHGRVEHHHDDHRSNHDDEHQRACGERDNDDADNRPFDDHHHESGPERVDNNDVGVVGPMTAWASERITSP